MRLRTFVHQSPSRRRSRSAVAAVELAFVAPALVIITLGMFELSRGVVVKQALTGAARKGCRTGILHQYGNSDIVNDATNVMSDNGFTSSQFNPPSVGAVNITVTDPYGNPLSDVPPGSTVSVQAVNPATSVNWVSYYYLKGNMVESDIIVMMKQ